ncbi:hypothetical protein [Jeongeupia sp. HS-3]|uniref:hypothetical protein n=1 Tax=Jeongeupia sp. HS-3 TaxID=1009682 RepID=UPI00190FC34F|nr:hypothetical protein [Jeongeupia sp. HS-3]
MSKWIFALVQFFPLSLFATYAFWGGAPTDQRWQEAFQLAAVASLIQLAIVLPQHRPVNRLVLAANIYLLLGGAAFQFHQWWFLKLYDQLREAAIFTTMIGVGIISMLFTNSGYASLISAPRHVALRASLWLLAATALALVASVIFRGDRTYAAVLPIIGLAVLQRILVNKAHRHSEANAG